MEGKRKTHFGEFVVLLRNEEVKKNFTTTGVVLPRKKEKPGSGGWGEQLIAKSEVC